MRYAYPIPIRPGAVGTRTFHNTRRGVQIILLFAVHSNIGIVVVVVVVYTHRYEHIKLIRRILSYLNVYARIYRYICTYVISRRTEERTSVRIYPLSGSTPPPSTPYRCGIVSFYIRLI